MNRAVLLVSLVAIAASAAAAQAPSPYAGQEQRSIKALSADEVRDLIEGRGLGLAKAAELNSYPGPLHVLEIADQLALSDAQITATKSLHSSMRDKARHVGALIIEAERNLDRAFAAGSIDGMELRTRVNAIATLQAELRVAHLEAHLAQRRVLAPEQVVRYNALRGYDSDVTHHRIHPQDK
jgi:Spy/CpxP family protein refolding chaperone